MLKNRNYLLGMSLIFFGIVWYIWNPFKKEFNLSKIPVVTINGKMQLKDYFSKKTILYFGYTTCPTVCPMTLANVAEALNKYKKTDIKVIFISLSPKDTFKKTYDYGQTYHKKIFAIEMSQENTELLGKWLNVQYRNTDDGEINHSGNLYLFNNKKIITVLPFGDDPVSIFKELQGMK